MFPCPSTPSYGIIPGIPISPLTYPDTSVRGGGGVCTAITGSERCSVRKTDAFAGCRHAAKAEGGYWSKLPAPCINCQLQLEMYANSSPVDSTQSLPHEKLEAVVARHRRSPFRKPILHYNERAFEQAVTAWRASGLSRLILDSGCGVGLSTMNLAVLYPDHFVIGVDQSAHRLTRNTFWSGDTPRNHVLVRAELSDFWRLLDRERIRLDRHYLLYPNPWPKIGQLQRRWHGHPVFPLLPRLGGTFECRSNWRIYIEECARALGFLGVGDVLVEPVQPDPPITPFERKYHDSGHSLWRCGTTFP